MPVCATSASSASIRRMPSSRPVHLLLLFCVSVRAYRLFACTRGVRILRYIVSFAANKKGAKRCALSVIRGVLLDIARPVA